MLISGKQGKSKLSPSPLPLLWRQHQQQRPQQQQRCQRAFRVRHMSQRHARGSLNAGAASALLIAVLLFLSDDILSPVAAKDGSAVGSSSVGTGASAENPSKLDLLRNNLFTNYDKNAHPIGKDNVLSTISLGITINYVDIEELTGKMTLHTWLRISWTDMNRTWTASEFDNITLIHLKPRDIWKPLITNFNAAGSDGAYVGDTQVLLYRNGDFLWVPPAIFTTYCALNLALWPYDTQTCTVKVGTFGLTALEKKEGGHGHDVIDYQELVQSTEWEITESNAEYGKSDDFNFIEFKIVLKRRSSMYKAIIFTPASCIILLSLSVFWLPPQMGEKILLNGIVIVIIGAFLMHFAQMLPILAENTPLVVLFYSSSMLLLSISTVVAVIVLYLSTAKHKKRIPNCMKQLLNGPLGNVLLLSQFSMESEVQSFTNQNTNELTDHIYQESIVNEPTYADYHNSNANNADVCAGGSGDGCGETTQRSIQYGWILLATAVDRIFFILYSLIFIVLAIIYAV